MFVLIYAIMFIATGARIIVLYDNHVTGSHRDTCLATGSMAIITGVVMVVDFALLLKTILKK